MSLLNQGGTFHKQSVIADRQYVTKISKYP